MERTHVRCYTISGALDGKTGQMVFEVQTEEDRAISPVRFGGLTVLRIGGMKLSLVASPGRRPQATAIAKLFKRRRIIQQ